MRLVCPNCGAQYEVGEDVIPGDGRDVQCSNCGHTWFEVPGASAAAETALQQPSAPEPAAPSMPEPEAAAEPEPEQLPGSEAESEPVSEPPETAPRRREMDEGVASILREEAEYERSAREAEAEPIETQTDLNLTQDPDEDRRSREARDRLARLRGEADPVSASAAAAVGSGPVPDPNAPRRDLLPDIEEINSTLRQDGASPAAAEEPEEEAERRSGFRRGFVLVVVLALVALTAYVFAPQISAALPQAEPVMTTYVEWVNELRLWLDAQVQDLLDGADAGGAVSGS